MKAYKYILIAAAVLVGAASCNNLDLEPKGMLDDGTLFSSEFGIKKYFSGLYNDMPIEDFCYKYADDGKGYSTERSAGYHTGNVWEAQKGYGSTIAGETTGRGNGDMGGAWGYWPYGRIREINTFIEKFPLYKDAFTETRANELLAEGRFIRAFYYFALAKRYGGVPIISDVQDPTRPLEDLKVARETEYNTWKFIYDDLKFAMEYGASDKTDVTRGNRYSAAALMAKAMLWAGCVAKYNQYTGITGEATEKGLMGMEPSDAKEFFKYAYDACKFIHDAGFSLHKGADKEKAYTEIFIEDLAGEEDIFVKQFGTANTVVPWNSSLYSSYDSMTLPKGTGMAQDVGAAIHATWELVSLYERPEVTDPDGYPIRFNSLDEFWKSPEMEPRCRANFFFSGMTEPVSGVVLDIQAGVYKEYPGTAKAGTPDRNEEDAYAAAHRVRAARPGTVQKINDKEYKINGANGYATGTGDEGYSTTGVFVRKYINYKADVATRKLHGSTQAWKVFRYGEIVMNWAEAAYELGLETGNNALKQEAFDLVNEIRDRAGAHPHAMVASPEDIGTELYGFPVDENLKYIRDERMRELCIENQSEWDQRRWRIADSKFQNYMPHTLFGYYVIAEDKYIYLNEAEVFGRTMTFQKRFYYEQIPGGEINKNDKLIRNDGY